MFVISLLCSGRLKKTAIKRNANDAVDVAKEWFLEFKDSCGSNGYIAIDHQEKKQTETVRFAEIQFDQDFDEEVRLYIVHSDKPVFASRYSQITQKFLITFLEYAVIKLAEYLKDKNRKDGFY